MSVLGSDKHTPIIYKAAGSCGKLDDNSRQQTETSGAVVLFQCAGCQGLKPLFQKGLLLALSTGWKPTVYRLRTLV